jgi:transcriptional regulator with XRE-family HTH domain
MAVMTDDRATRTELGAFLRARRAELAPADVGMVDDGTPRRVPGLRRDEVARLASISVDYYTRIEQGRLALSATVLTSLVRALRLDEGQQRYLAELSGAASRPRRRPVQRVRPSMQQLLDQLDRSPAMVLGRYNDILAWNAAAVALYGELGTLTPAERNYTRLVFLDPGFRSLYDDWEDAARLGAATLRMEAAANPDDPRLASLVGELSVRSEDFRRWWAGRIVSAAAAGPKKLRHPVAGSMTLWCDTWANPEDPEQRLLVMTAEAGSPSEEAMRILTSWRADDERRILR